MEARTAVAPHALTFVVFNELYQQRVMDTLRACGIDYYTRWNHVSGKGHGTEPHLGHGAYGSTNAVLMIAFQDPAPLEKFIAEVGRFNADTPRPDDRVRLFQVPLARIV